MKLGESQETYCILDLARVRSLVSCIYKDCADKGFPMLVVDRMRGSIASCMHEP